MSFDSLWLCREVWEVEATPETIGQRFAGLTVDDVGALAEFLKHCAGYTRDVRTALVQSTWPEDTK